MVGVSGKQSVGISTMLEHACFTVSLNYKALRVGSALDPLHFVTLVER